MLSLSPNVQGSSDLKTVKNSGMAIHFHHSAYKSLTASQHWAAGLPAVYIARESSSNFTIPPLFGSSSSSRRSPDLISFQSSLSGSSSRLPQIRQEAMDRSASSSLLCLILASLLLLLAVVPSCSSAGGHQSGSGKPKRPSTYKFYWHDTLQNKTHPWTNTAAEVAGPNHNITGLGFGKVIVFNDSLTVGPRLESKLLGRGQGVYIYDRTQAGIAFNALLVFSAVIENEEYNGTLNFMGADIILAPSRDISVVGGTGDFAMARGIANLVTHSIDGETFIVNVTSSLYYPSY